MNDIEKHDMELQIEMLDNLYQKAEHERDEAQARIATLEQLLAAIIANQEQPTIRKSVELYMQAKKLLSKESTHHAQP